MLRTIGNILLIALLFISAYSFRDTVRPVAQKIGDYVQGVIVSIENQYGGKKELLQITTEIKKEISAPGPLEVTGDPKPSTGGGTSSTTGISRANIVYWTNQARKANGSLPALTENKVLDSTALLKTDDMFAKDYFEHVSPSGVDVSDQAKDAGYEYIMIGENLALGSFNTAKAIVDAWMQSPGHRANILNNRYTEIGIGVHKGMYQGREVWIATQHFGLPKNACPSVNENLKALIAQNQAEIETRKDQIEAKKQQIDSTSQLSPNYNTYINEYNELVRIFNELVTNTKSEIVTYNDEVQAYNLCIQG